MLQANLSPRTSCKASLVGENNSEDCLQNEGHCSVDAKDQSIVLMFHMSGNLNSAVCRESTLITTNVYEMGKHMRVHNDAHLQAIVLYALTLHIYTREIHSET